MVKMLLHPAATLQRAAPAVGMAHGWDRSAHLFQAQMEKRPQPVQLWVVGWGRSVAILPPICPTHRIGAPQPSLLAGPLRAFHVPRNALLLPPTQCSAPTQALPPPCPTAPSRHCCSVPPRHCSSVAFPTLHKGLQTPHLQNATGAPGMHHLCTTALPTVPSAPPGASVLPIKQNTNTPSAPIHHSAISSQQQTPPQGPRCDRVLRSYRLLWAHPHPQLRSATWEHPAAACRAEMGAGTARPQHRDPGFIASPHRLRLLYLSLRVPTGINRDL